MGKRKSNEKLGAAEKRQKDTSTVIPSDVAMQFVLHPWMGRVLEKYDSLWAQYQDVTEILDAYMGSDALKLEWFTWLSEKFPRDPDMQYLDDREDFSVRRVMLRPHMCSWDKSAGNKGWVMSENFRALIQMVLAKGFLTNPDVPGVEMPVCSRHHPKLVKLGDMYQPDIEDGVLPANSISMVKGWSRVCAMHLVLKMCVEVEVFDQYMAYLGDRTEGFCTIHATLQLCTGDADPMDVNRGMCSFLKNVFKWL